jgi:hypothetical protein
LTINILCGYFSRAKQGFYPNAGRLSKKRKGLIVKKIVVVQKRNEKMLEAGLLNAKKAAREGQPFAIAC